MDYSKPWKLKWDITATHKQLWMLFCKSFIMGKDTMSMNCLQAVSLGVGFQGSALRWAVFGMESLSSLVGNLFFSEPLIWCSPSTRDSLDLTWFSALPSHNHGSQRPQSCGVDWILWSHHEAVTVWHLLHNSCLFITNKCAATISISSTLYSCVSKGFLMREDLLLLQKIWLWSGWVIKPQHCLHHSGFKQPWPVQHGCWPGQRCCSTLWWRHLPRSRGPQRCSGNHWYTLLHCSAFEQEKAKGKNVG